MIRRAIGYVETLVATAVLAIGVATALATFGSFARGAALHRDRALAAGLAAQLASEIRLQAFEDPATPIFGPEAGENDGTRLAFDDVDDYDGWSASPPQLRDGTVLADLAGFTQSVTVTYDASRHCKIITVTITRSGQRLARVVLAKGHHDADAD